jgi:hypothetical protein
MLWFDKVNKCLEKRKASENSNEPRRAAGCFGEKEGVVGFAFRRFLAKSQK